MPNSSAAAQKTILIVPRNCVAEKRTAIILERAGFVILRTSSAEVASQTSQGSADKINIFLLNIAVTGMYGIDLGTALNIECSDMSVFVMSALQSGDILFLDHGRAFVTANHAEHQDIPAWRRR